MSTFTNDAPTSSPPNDTTMRNNIPIVMVRHVESIRNCCNRLRGYGNTHAQYIDIMSQRENKSTPLSTKGVQSLGNITDLFSNGNNGNVDNGNCTTNIFESFQTSPLSTFTRVKRVLIISSRFRRTLITASAIAAGLNSRHEPCLVTITTMDDISEHCRLTPEVMASIANRAFFTSQCNTNDQQQPQQQQQQQQTILVHEHDKHHTLEYDVIVCVTHSSCIRSLLKETKTSNPTFVKVDNGSIISFTTSPTTGKSTFISQNHKVAHKTSSEQEMLDNVYYAATTDDSWYDIQV